MPVAGYMLDTNVFNSVRDGALALTVFEGLVVYTTHIQQNELNGTRDTFRKAELLKVFRAIDAVALPTESAVWGISEWGQAKWPEDDDWLERLLQLVREYDKADGKKKSSENTLRDALIAETAMKTGLVLVTNDGGLLKAVRTLGGTAIDTAELARACSS